MNLNRFFVGEIKLFFFSSAVSGFWVCISSTKMSKNRYVSDSSRGVFDDDDVDDDEFLSRVRPIAGYRTDRLGNQELENARRQKQQIVDTAKDVEQRTLQSTQRTLRLLKESEDVGTATAEVNDRACERSSATLPYAVMFFAVPT